jgi:hypothetical protein
MGCKKAVIGTYERFYCIVEGFAIERAPENLIEYSRIPSICGECIMSK